MEWMGAPDHIEALLIIGRPLFSILSELETLQDVYIFFSAVDHVKKVSAACVENRL